MHITSELSEIKLKRRVVVPIVLETKTKTKSKLSAIRRRVAELSPVIPAREFLACLPAGEDS